jgi:leucyl-tRNA synthetase
VAVPEKDLPVLLPEIIDFKPSGDKSPLARAPEFVHVKCPQCGADAERETDTMDTFVDSSWYFLRYLDPKFADGPWDPELARKWLPVDMYIGGAEHAVMHLMYARFFCMFLNDIGLTHFDEPFLKLRHQGVITATGSKISKSRGNVINPDSFIDKYGSDTFRMYLMFMGSYSLGGDWNDSGISGISRFLGRVYRLVMQYREELRRRTNITYADIKAKDISLDFRLSSTIKRVGHDTDALEFNTAIAVCMELVNDLYKIIDENKPKTDLFYFTIKQLILVMAPYAPHLAEELWSQIGGPVSVFDQAWPGYSEDALRLENITMVVQVNGKFRGNFEVSADIDETRFFDIASRDERVAKQLDGKEVIKRIFVPGKLLNIVVR